MKEEKNIANNNEVYYRLIAVWVVCEAMLGGIIHGFRIPVSGLVVGSCAITCICLIAWYAPGKGNIIKATIIVAIFKMMLSPQAPPPAYIAVFFQGLMGELLFRKRSFYKIACILLAVAGLLESGLQRILVLTIISGQDLWNAINIFLNGLTKQKTATNYSLVIGAGYVALHFITGLLVGSWVARLPQRIENWKKDKKIYLKNFQHETPSPFVSAKRKRRRTSLFILWIGLIALYIQSYFKIGTPLLPSHISLKILLRSLIIVLTWIFIAGPLLRKWLHNWLRKKQGASRQEVKAVLELLPQTEQIMRQTWKNTNSFSGFRRLQEWSKAVLVNTLHPATIKSPVTILTGKIQSGKTTSLLNVITNRNDVAGILTPLVDGKRVFYDITTGDQFAMEAEEDESETVNVGRFVFSKRNFEKAIRIVENAINQNNWLIIDEIGPLELKDQGFAGVLNNAIREHQGKTVLVVREGLTDKVIQKFGLGDATITGNINELI